MEHARIVSMKSKCALKVLFSLQQLIVKKRTRNFINLKGNTEEKTVDPYLTQVDLLPDAPNID